jgi:hypothetical protein
MKNRALTSQDVDSEYRTGQSGMEGMIRIAKAMIVKRLRASFCLPPSKDSNLTYNG